MALFRFRWLRRMVRKHTNPIAQDSAHVWKQRLSFAYAFLAWNACGFIIYQFYKGKADWASKFLIKNYNFGIPFYHLFISSLSRTSKGRWNRSTAIRENARNRKSTGC